MPRDPQPASKRALALFDDYADMPAAQRERALARLLEQDAELHDALVRLLSNDAGGSILDVAPATILARQAPAPPSGGTGEDDRIGTRLGAWRIDAVIGTGGMGTVYAAHRADGQYEQQVALKTIRAEIASPSTREAFLRERNALARLAHPDIVPLLDGGLDAQGAPWLTMQRVDGAPIDAWCDARNLGVRERVRLLAIACDAVVFAHEHDVLHQDLKPANLLVTENGRPKLLDFGLSALLRHEPRQEDARLAISAGYAAPEARRGATPSVAMDVYSLGVVLYRLLCAQWPVEPRLSAAGVGGGDDDTPAPRAPSQLALALPAEALATRGHASTGRLSRLLRGDLDAIAMKCCAVDPAQRYAQVSALRGDLQAWLHRRPVVARDAGRAYRFACFLRRHGLIAALTAAIACAAVPAILVAYLHAHVSSERFRVSETLARTFEDTTGSAMMAGLGEQALHPRVMLERAEKDLRQQAQGDDLLLQSGLDWLARSRTTIGDYAYATRLAAEARDIGDTLWIGNNRRTSATLASLLNRQAQYAHAERIAANALSPPFPNRWLVPGSPGDTVRLRISLASALWGQGKIDQAFAEIDQAILEGADLDAPKRPLLVEALGKRGDWHTQLYRLPEAEADFARALDIARTVSTLLEDEVNLHRIRFDLRRSQLQEAHTLAEQVYDRRKASLGEGHPETAQALIVLGEARHLLWDTDAAISASESGKATLEAVVGRNVPEVGTALATIGRTKAMWRDNFGCVRDMRAAIRIYQTTLGASHIQTLNATRSMAMCLSSASQQPDVPAAHRKTLLESALRLHRVSLQEADRQQIPMYNQWIQYALAMTSSDDYETYGDDIRLALDNAETQIVRLHGQQQTILQFVHYLRGWWLYRTGSKEAAWERLQSITDDLRGRDSKDSMTWSILGDTHESLGDFAIRDRDDPELAREHWQLSLEAWREISAVDSDNTSRLRGKLQQFDERH